MGEYLHKYQRLSALVLTLPDHVPPSRYLAAFRDAVKAGTLQAAPLAETFRVGTARHHDDLVRVSEAFQAWHQQILRTYDLRRARRGVVAHADDLQSGAADFDALAERYRQQVVARASVKPPRPGKTRRTPKLDAARLTPVLPPPVDPEPRVEGGSGRPTLSPVGERPVT